MIELGFFFKLYQLLMKKLSELIKFLLPRKCVTIMSIRKMEVEGY